MQDRVPDPCFAAFAKKQLNWLKGIDKNLIDGEIFSIPAKDQKVLIEKLHKDSYEWAKKDHKKEQEKRKQCYNNQYQQLEKQYLENLTFWNRLPPTVQISSPKPKKPERTAWRLSQNCIFFCIMRSLIRIHR